MPRLLLAVTLTVCFALSATAATFEHGPYAGAPSRDSVVVSWTSSPSVPARVEFATRDDFATTGAMTDTMAVAALAEDPLVKTSHAILAALAPASDYVYRVVLVDGENETASAVGAFSTAPDVGTPVSFGCIILSTENARTLYNWAEMGTPVWIHY